MALRPEFLLKVRESHRQLLYTDGNGTQLLEGMRSKCRGLLISSERLPLKMMCCYLAGCNGNGRILACTQLLQPAYLRLILSHLLVLQIASQVYLLSKLTWKIFSIFCYLPGFFLCIWQNPKNSLFWNGETRKASLFFSDYILNLDFILYQGGELSGIDCLPTLDNEMAL